MPLFSFLVSFAADVIARRKMQGKIGMTIRMCDELISKGSA